MAGEEDDLPVDGLFFENRHGPFQPKIIKPNQGIIQNQGRLGGQCLGNRQSQSQIQQVCGAVAAPQGSALGILVGGCGMRVRSFPRTRRS